MNRAVYTLLIAQFLTAFADRDPVPGLYHGHPGQWSR